MQLFLIHDAQFFHERLGPALAVSWRRRSFRALREPIAAASDTLVDNARRDRLTADEQPLFLRCESLTFDRPLWRHLAGELLLYLAIETPAFPTASELLSRFMPADLVERLHRGSRPVNFGGVPYRPDHAGYHDIADIAELALQLSAIDTGTWTPDGLTDIPPEEREDELAFARHCFTDLREMIETAYANERVIVCEQV